ncbi:MAG: hypothetical protein WCG93_14460, partial [Paludibacter sp.]
GDVVSVELNSNATPCLVGSLVVSNGVKMAVNPNLTPSITIIASENNVCANTEVTFTATPVNGGTTPIYQWKVNDVNAGTNSSTFAYNPVNGDVVKVELNSNATPCLVGSLVASNGVTMAVNPNLTPSVAIAASENNVCANTEVTFTATPTNGGTTPVYQWKVNDVNAGTNSSTFAYNPINGDVVKVELNSNATPCLVGSLVASNGVTMAVNPNLTPSVAIVASENNVCNGSTVTFNATSTNEGTKPIYQWYKNNLPVGSGTTIYEVIPINGDEISVTLASNATPCLMGSPVASNTVIMLVNPLKDASASIDVSANPINSNIPVTFTATAIDCGTAPSYKWYKNQILVGDDSNSYTYLPNNNDNVSVEITPDPTSYCFAVNPVASSSIRMVVSINTKLNNFNDSNISIYSSDKNIYVACPQKLKQIYIVTTLGTAIKLESNVSGLKKFDLSNYPNAYYFVKIVTDNNVYTQKVLLK